MTASIYVGQFQMQQVIFGFVTFSTYKIQVMGGVISVQLVMVCSNPTNQKHTPGGPNRQPNRQIHLSFCLFLVEVFVVLLVFPALLLQGRKAGLK